MTPSFDPFDKEFRRRAHGMRRTPSSQAWNRVERNLDRRDRSGGASIYGLRPWMIAALLVLAVGLISFSALSQRSSSPLAQRAQSVEELDEAFAPADNFDAESYRALLRQSDDFTSDRAPEFRDLTVAEKYRS